MNNLKWQTAGMFIAAGSGSFIIAMLDLDPTRAWKLMLAIGIISLAGTLLTRKYLIWGFTMNSFIASILGITHSVEITWQQQLSAAACFIVLTFFLFLAEGGLYAYKNSRGQRVKSELHLNEEMPVEKPVPEDNYEETLLHLKQAEKSKTNGS